jgi:MFS family permease
MKHFRLLALASAFVMMGFAIQRSVYSNFAYHELGLTAGLVGWVEAWRELPGLLAALMALVAVWFTRAHLQVVTIFLIGFGLFLFSYATGFWTLVLFTVIQSIGFHLWIPVQEAMLIEHAKPEERGLWLGRLNSANAAAAVAGMALVYVLADRLTFRDFFQIGGVIAMAGTVVALQIRSATRAVTAEKFIFRWRYRSYYILSLLSGARRQVLVTFAFFALVAVHGAPVSTIAALTAVSSVLAIYTRAFFGRVIDRYGETRSLSAAYLAAAAVFLGYAFVPVAWVVYLLFIIDNTLLGMDIAITTHAAKLIDKNDLGPTLAMGLTTNHVTAVALPVTGGILWEALGPQATFGLGAACCLVAVVVALLLRTGERAGAPQEVAG